jgi:alditol oxidase
MATGGKITNWAGNLAYGTGRLEQPGSMAEAQAWIKKQPRFKVLGTRHCFNDIADSGDGFLSLTALDKIVALDKGKRTAIVEAGVRYGELAVLLQEQGLALHNLASLPHISVAGGCATATHGSGIHNGSLASAVVGMEYWTPEGETVYLSAAADRERFLGAVVHLGGIGVVTLLELALQPAYAIRQYVFENLPVAALERHFDAIMSAGYSVSLFTDWTGNNINEVWVKKRAGEDGAVDGTAFFGATPATQDLHPIRGLPAEHCTPQLGTTGLWHERLPHFRLGFTPSSGKELQSEYFVGREHSYEAIRAVEKLHAQISPLLQVSELRCIAADEYWMSPFRHRDSTAIHFTWKPDWPAVRELLPKIEAALAPFGARPHWGKLFMMSHERLAELYPKMGAFRELMQTYDPQGKLRNSFLNRTIFGSTR